MENGKVKIIKPKNRFIATTREYYEWKQTAAHRKWKHRQLMRQNRLCYYCLCKLDGIVYCVEHINPRNLGGSNRPGNLVLSCLPCNKDKGSRKLTVKEKKFYRDRFKAGL